MKFIQKNNYNICNNYLNLLKVIRRRTKNLNRFIYLYKTDFLKFKKNEIFLTFENLKMII